MRFSSSHISLEIASRTEQARGVLRPLDVPCDPEDRLRHPAQHRHRSLHPAGRVGGRQASATHVSLVPPPCEELTTSEPRLSATRVRPPGTSVTSSPKR